MVTECAPRDPLVWLCPFPPLCLLLWTHQDTWMSPGLPVEEFHRWRPLALLLCRVMLTPLFLGLSASALTINRGFACLGLHRVGGSMWFTCLRLFREKRRGGQLCASFEHQLFWKNTVKDTYVMRMWYEKSGGVGLGDLWGSLPTQSILLLYKKTPEIYVFFLKYYISKMIGLKEPGCDFQRASV